MGLNDIHSLSHSKWNCKYHVVFAPKYRRQVFYGEKKIAVGKILRQLCEWKGVNILNCNAFYLTKNEQSKTNDDKFIRPLYNKT